MFIHELLKKERGSGFPEATQEFEKLIRNASTGLQTIDWCTAPERFPAMIRRNNRRKDQSERTNEKLGPNENPTQPLQQLVRNYFS